MKEAFITGATGFVGCRLLKLLEELGYKIQVLSRKQHPVYKTTICNLGKEQIPMSSLESVDTVFSLAGYAHALIDNSHVESLYRKVNLNATVKLAELSAQHGVQSFVFVSSVKAGGPCVVGRCASEEDQREPVGIYGKTKREAELKLLEIGCQSNMHVSIVRPSLVYGPRVKGNLRSMLSGIEKGWFPPLPEVGNRRSMIHVDDLVYALLLVANDENANGEIFIATDGQSYSSREIYEAMCCVLGKSVPQWSVPKSFFDIFALVHPRAKDKVNKLLGDDYYSSEKLQSLGFKPNFSIFEMGEENF